MSHPADPPHSQLSGRGLDTLQRFLEQHSTKESQRNWIRGNGRLDLSFINDPSGDSSGLECWLLPEKARQVRVHGHGPADSRLVWTEPTKCYVVCAGFSWGGVRQYFSQSQMVEFTLAGILRAIDIAHARYKNEDFFRIRLAPDPRSVLAFSSQDLSSAFD